MSLRIQERRNRSRSADRREPRFQQAPARSLKREVWACRPAPVVRRRGRDIAKKICRRSWSKRQRHPSAQMRRIRYAGVFEIFSVNESRRGDVHAPARESGSVGTPPTTARNPTALPDI